jgi:aspartyl-tRNA(Asn)/glutamyl-tRNA(Gln) amidotransferase subunit A
MKSIPQIQKELQEKKTTVTEIVNHFLSEIETNKHLNIFIEVFSEDAKTKAFEIQEKVNLGKGGKLAGIVIGIKDNICYKNHHVSASSKILENFESIYSSTVVERLLSEDAIISTIKMAVNRMALQRLCIKNPFCSCMDLSKVLMIPIMALDA